MRYNHYDRYVQQVYRMGETGNPSKGFVLIMQDCIDTICERKMMLCNTSS